MWKYVSWHQLDLCFTNFDNFLIYKSSYKGNGLFLSFFIWDLWKQNLFLNWRCKKNVSWHQLDLCFTNFDYISYQPDRVSFHYFSWICNFSHFTSSFLWNFSTYFLHLDLCFTNFDYSYNFIANSTFCTRYKSSHLISYLVGAGII